MPDTACCEVPGMTTADAFRVSVIIPSYNSGRFLAESIESVLAQTLPPQEVIVVDDGSTDDTPAVAAHFEGRIVYHRQANRGVSAARNAGIERATGNWLAFLDADDLWEPEKLERVASACCSQPQPTVVFTDFRTFGTQESVMRASAELRNWRPEEFLLVPFVAVLPSAALVPAGLPVRFVEWAGNDSEDAIYFNELAALGPVQCVPEPLTQYRRHEASAQAKGHAAGQAHGYENLLRWATAREPAAPGTLVRLFRTLAEVAVVARWKRNWAQYRMLRGFCDRHWPTDVPRPAVLTERVWPKLVYQLKDAVDRLRAC
jgi:glycosyltransferase involved in cell wall biosynthesis